MQLTKKEKLLIIGLREVKISDPSLKIFGLEDNIVDVELSSTYFLKDNQNELIARIRYENTDIQISDFDVNVTKSISLDDHSSPSNVNNDEDNCDCHHNKCNCEDFEDDDCYEDDDDDENDEGEESVYDRFSDSQQEQILKDLNNVLRNILKVTKTQIEDDPPFMFLTRKEAIDDIDNDWRELADYLYYDNHPLNYLIERSKFKINNYGLVAMLQAFINHRFESGYYD